MKVLWITNILFPEAEALLGFGGQLKGSGGWLIGGAECLAKTRKDIEVAVATVSNRVNELKVLHGNVITYYVIPLGKGNLSVNMEYESSWKRVEKEYAPDIVHIHGTEFSHGLSYIRACGNQNVVLSIQGLKSEISKYYLGGISTLEAFFSTTFRDILKDTLIGKMLSFKKQGKYEHTMIKEVNHIIGRTTWDRAHTWAVNPDARYYVCNETLQNAYYEGYMWNKDKCQSHSIFLSQAGYPLKGLHIVLKAMPLVLREFPDAKIRVAGDDITRTNKGLKGFLKLPAYGLILRRLIRKLKLENTITFTGSLDAYGMREEYLKCNLFICPSAVENSPNSLGEAQILGVPSLASYVGGIPDMMKQDFDNLYRFEDHVILAYKICKVFREESKTEIVKLVAKERHDKNNNLYTVIEIYNKIIGNISAI